MAYDINSALERLENNLKNIDSARLQVEKTITSSNNLQSIISSFVKSLDSLHENVKNLITDLGKFQALKKEELQSSVDSFKSSCESAIVTFNNGIEQSTSVFKAKMNEIISSLEGEIEKLATYVNELIALKEILNNSANATKSLECKLDNMSQDINQILKEQRTSLTSVQNSFEKTNNQIDSITSILKSNLGDIKSETNSIIEKTDTIISAQSELKSICNNIESEMALIKKTNDAILSTFSKDTKINRLLIIIGFIILAILLFIN